MSEFYHYTDEKYVADIAANGLKNVQSGNFTFTTEKLHSEAEVLDRLGLYERGEAVLKFADDGKFKRGKDIEPNPNTGPKSYKGGGDQYAYSGKGPLKPIEGRNIKDKDWLPIADYLKTI